MIRLYVFILILLVTGLSGLQAQEGLHPNVDPNACIGVYPDRGHTLDELVKAYEDGKKMHTKCSSNFDILQKDLFTARSELADWKKSHSSLNSEHRDLKKELEDTRAELVAEKRKGR